MDFRNTAEHIRDAFLPFYERTEATPTDPNVLFDAAEKVRDFGVISDCDLAALAEAYATLAGLAPEKQHALLSKLTQPAFNRAGALDAGDRRELRDALDRFIRFYGFIAQALRGFRRTRSCSTSSAVCFYRGFATADPAAGSSTSPERSG